MFRILQRILKFLFKIKNSFGKLRQKLNSKNLVVANPDSKVCGNRLRAEPYQFLITKRQQIVHRVCSI